MAGLILLVASGILLSCPTLATFATSGGDDDGSSSNLRDLAMIRPLTSFWNGSIEQEEERFARNINWNPQSHPSGGAYQPAETYPSNDPYHQQVPFAQPQLQLGAYPDYQPSSAVQPHADPYSVYQPASAPQPQAESYQFYQPAPADSYPFYHNAPAVPQASEPYPVYQPAPVSQPQPAYQHASMPLPSHSGYSPYPRHYPSPPMPTQPNTMIRYVPGAVTRRYQCQQKVDCGWKYITEPGKYVYIQINRDPIIDPRPITPVCPQQYCTNTNRPCNNPSPPYNPPSPPYYPPSPPYYPPSPPYYPPSPPIYRPDYPIYPPGPPSYPPFNPVYPPEPTYPPAPCSGHDQCGSGRQCCYGATSTNMGCYPGAAATLRSQRHLQFNSTMTSGSHVELVIGDWRNSNVTSFVIDLLLPLKVDLEHDMEVILRTDPEQDGSPCDTQDTDCIGQRVLSCVTEMLPSVIQPQAVAWSAPNNIPFQLIPPSVPMREQLEAGFEEPLANTTTDLHNVPGEDDSRIFAGPAVSAGDPLEVVQVDPVSRAAHARQVRLLSFTACLLQSFGTGVVERKKSALLTAKRCVRAHKLEWPRVRACVAGRGRGVAGMGRGQDSPHTRPLEITVNGEPVPDLGNFNLAFCRSLLKAGQAPLLCDLLYDELDQSQEEQVLANTENGSTDHFSNEAQDSPNLRHIDSQGPGRGWSEQRLGFSQGLPQDPTHAGPHRGQELFRMQETYGAQDNNEALVAEAEFQLENVEWDGVPALA